MKVTEAIQSFTSVNYLLFLCKCMHLSMEILKEKLVLPTNRLFRDCYMFHSRHRMFNIFYGFLKIIIKNMESLIILDIQNVSHFPIFSLNFLIVSKLLKTSG